MLQRRNPPLLVGRPVRPIGLYTQYSPSLNHSFQKDESLAPNGSQTVVYWTCKQHINNDYLQEYTDGSKGESGVGAAFYIPFHKC